MWTTSKRPASSDDGERGHAQPLEQLGERILPSKQRHLAPQVAVNVGKAAYPHAVNYRDAQ